MLEYIFQYIISTANTELEEPEESAMGGEEPGTQDEVGEDGVKKRKPRRVFGLGVGGFIVRARSRQWLAKRQSSYEEQEDHDKGMLNFSVEACASNYCHFLFKL